METIRHIKVDLYGAVKRFAVAAKQMDMGTRYIGVTLMEDGVVYEIPNDAEIIINMTKPDRTHVHNDGEKSGNEALIPLTRNMLIYGLGGVIVPFIGIKVIDLIIAPLLTMLGLGMAM